VGCHRFHRCRCCQHQQMAVVRLAPPNHHRAYRCWYRPPLVGDGL